MTENQKNRFRNTILALAFVTVSGCMNSCSTLQESNSAWSTAGINIDGNDSEWQGFARYFPDEKLAVSIRNDSSMLYVYLKTNDQAAMHKIMALGLTLWLNNEADDSKQFGIHYPLGFAGKGGMPQNEPGKLPGRGLDKNKRDGETDQAAIWEKEGHGMRMPAEVELLIDEGEDINFTRTDEIKQKYGIQLAVNEAPGEALVYEAAIPLDLKAFSLNFLNSGEFHIGLGFESGEVKLQDNPSQGFGGSGNGPGSGPGGMPPGGGPGGMPSMGGGRHGGGMGMPGAPSDKSMNKIKVWLDVKLAKNSQDTLPGVK